jgi:hypothetical protein
LLGRTLTGAGGSSNPGWLQPIWSRFNLLLLLSVSLGVVATPCFAGGNRGILLWTCIEGVLAVSIWVFAVANKARPGSVLPTNSSCLAAQAITSGAITALAVIIFATLIMPRIDSANRHRSREVAGAIRAGMPSGAQLWVLEESYRPFWYYLEPNVRYFRQWADLPAQADYFLLPAAETKTLLQNPIWRNAPPLLIRQVIDSEKRAFDLFARKAHFQNSS